ncbi:hypothetical protein CRT37_23515 [Escherichia coli]|nr:hypothetical protein CRT37_23515 [Escherichia coli]
MLPSETMIWQPEFTDKILSRKPGAVHCPFNGRDGLIHQAGVLKMGGSGLFQLCQCGLQIFRDSVVRHFPAPRHFRLRKL